MLSNKFRVWKDYSAQFEFLTIKDMLQSESNDLERLGNSGAKRMEQCIGIKTNKGEDIYFGDCVYVAGYGYLEVQDMSDVIEIYQSSAEDDVEYVVGNIHEHSDKIKELDKQQ